MRLKKSQAQPSFVRGFIGTTQPSDAALDQTELDDANERGVGARIEFRREGHARVTMTISRALVEKATALNWSTGELFAEAIQIALPGAFNIEALGKATPRAA